MVARSCRKIDVLNNADKILSSLLTSSDPVSITEISRSTGLSIDSVFRQVGTMADLRWVEKIGEGYVLGMRLAVIWAKRKSVTETKILKAEQELSELVGGDNEEENRSRHTS